MADLGFLQLYFSCKNYQELAQARITKLVGFFTTKPTKLSLHFLNFLRFSTQFTRFSKTHLLFKTRFYRQVPGILVSLANRSQVHEKHTGKNEGDAM
jgi:hypothetical protein